MRKKVVAFLLLITTVGFGVLLAPDAGATRYTVTQCGWHVGMDASWADSSADKFTRSSYCQAPASADPFENVHLTSETRASTRTVGGTRFARWRWQAPAGTGIVTIHGQRWHVLKDGFQHRIGAVSAGGGFRAFAEYDSTDLVKRDFAANFSPFASALESRLLCARADNKLCSADSKSVAGVRGLTITIDDSQRPVTSIGGQLSGGGWLRGSRSLTFRASDVGSGLRFEQTLIDGSVRAQTEHRCDKAFIAGQWRATKMRPCGTSASGSHVIQTAALSDGPHQWRECAVDFATNSGCLPDRTIRTDNTAPAAPRALSVAGGEGWHRQNAFDVAWQTPDQGVAAPVLGYLYRIQGGQGFESGVTPEFGNGPIPDLKVPAAGEYKLAIRLVDQAGNSNPAATAEVTLRLDDVPPVAYFNEPATEQPELLRVPIADAHSGPAGGNISYRLQGSEVWHRLPTEVTTGPDGPVLQATFPSEDVAEGSYEFQAAVTDRAGNVTLTRRRENGSPIVLRAPRRSRTELTARLGREGQRGLALTIPFGETARVEGRLTSSGGGGLAGQAIEMTESPTAGSLVSPSVTTAVTDGEGFFSVVLDRGVSRRVAVRFKGTPRLAEATAGPLNLKVTGALSLRATPRRLMTGRRLKLRGTVNSRDARRPARGNLVAIQYLERATRRWRPVLVARTDYRGRFHAVYRFRYITRKTRIRLRAVLLPSQYFPYETATSKSVRVSVRGRRDRSRRRG